MSIDNNAELIAAINQIMPFGKYSGRKLLQLPEPYLVWFYGKGFPEGKLGEQLALIIFISVSYSINATDLTSYFTRSN